MQGVSILRSLQSGQECSCSQWGHHLDPTGRKPRICPCVLTGPMDGGPPAAHPHQP